MSRSLLFWLVFVLLVFSFCGVFFVTEGPNVRYIKDGYRIVEVVLIGLLGWQVYGAAIKA